MIFNQFMNRAVDCDKLFNIIFHNKREVNYGFEFSEECCIFLFGMGENFAT